MATLGQKIGQMFMVGVQGESLSREERLTKVRQCAARVLPDGSGLRLDLLTDVPEPGRAAAIPASSASSARASLRVRTTLRSRRSGWAKRSLFSS